MRRGKCPATTQRHLRQLLIIPLKMPDLTSPLRESRTLTAAQRHWRTCSHGVIRRPLPQAVLAGGVIAATQIMRIPIAVQLVAAAHPGPAAVGADVGPGPMRPRLMQTAAHRVTSSRNGRCWPRACSMS